MTVTPAAAFFAANLRSVNVADLIALLGGGEDAVALVRDVLAAAVEKHDGEWALADGCPAGPVVGSLRVSELYVDRGYVTPGLDRVGFTLLASDDRGNFASVGFWRTDHDGALTDGEGPVGTVTVARVL